MKQQTFYQNYVELLESNYSFTSKVDFSSLVKLISPFSFDLGSDVLEQAQDIITTLHQVSHSPQFAECAQFADPEIHTKQNNHFSMLMAYDFHWDQETNSLKLIEVNTNAAGFLFVDTLYKIDQANASTNPWKNALDDLKNGFTSEAELCGLSCPRTAIIDEDVDQQKMYMEFELYKALLDSMGWDTEIADFQSLKWNSDSNALCNTDGSKVNFIYNRYNDFLLQESRSQDLRQAFLSESVCFSPNPREYQLLADKSRLIELSQSTLLQQLELTPKQSQILNSHLLKTYDLSNWTDHDHLWSERKKLFFKPKRAYGGKASYRGKSISRKAFESVMDSSFLAQQYCPADEVKLELDDIPSASWKYDLRFYAYQDHIQLACARIYQGQVTNFSQDFGGFCRVHFT